MTVVVTFLCTDGVVVAADSMLTTSIGGVKVSHYTGRKLSILQGPKCLHIPVIKGRGIDSESWLMVAMMYL